jgi:hypothetical protein
LTPELNLWQIYYLIRRQSDPPAYAPNNIDVVIAGVKGIEVLSDWPKARKSLGIITSESVTFSVAFSFSTITLFIDNQQLTCNEEILSIKWKTNLTNTIFNLYSLITFDKSVIYDQTAPWCPYFFKNAYLTTLEIDGIVDTFLVTNLLKFQQDTQANTTSINSTVQEIIVKGYNYKLDETILDKLAFEQVTYLAMHGSIAAIQPDLFKSVSFEHLSQIEIIVFSLNKFFHQPGLLKWIAYLDKYTRWIRFKQLDFDALSMNGPYNYPNSDLCLFADSFQFPQIKRLAVPLFFYSSINVCTDSLALLTQNYRFYDLKNNNFTHMSVQLYSLCWNGTKSQNVTFIQKKVEQCLLKQSNESAGGPYTFYIDYYDVEYLTQVSVDLLSFVFIPLTCILGLLLNLRVIWTVLKNKKVELKENFYTFMSLNSVFNCLFCLIYAFYPINYCLKSETGFFCSAVSSTITAQVFKIVFMGYFGEVLKMCSNISYIFITINRYMLIGQEHNATLTKISDLNFKLVVFVTIVFSLLMNVGHCFQYRINYGYTQILFLEDIIIDYPSIVVNNFSFHVYTIVYFLVNFVCFFVLNTWVEFCLLRNLRKEISDKRVKLEGEIRVSESNNTSGSEFINKLNRWKKKKIDQDAKKETRATVMVITNSGLNFFFRLPEILVFFSSDQAFLEATFSNLIFTFHFLISNFLNILLSVSFIFYIFSFSTNVCMFYLFNPKFKRCFSLWEINVKIK